MRVLRWIVAIFLGLYGLSGLLPPAMVAAVKYRWMALTPDMAAYGALAAWISWWRLLLWAGVGVGYIVCGVRLFRGQKAWTLYASVLVIQIVSWWPMSRSEAYRSAFSASELQLDYWVIAIQALVGVLIWWIQTRRPATPARA